MRFLVAVSMVEISLGESPDQQEIGFHIQSRVVWQRRYN